MITIYPNTAKTRKFATAQLDKIYISLQSAACTAAPPNSSRGAGSINEIVSFHSNCVGVYRPQKPQIIRNNIPWYHISIIQYTDIVIDHRMGFIKNIDNRKHILIIIGAGGLGVASLAGPGYRLPYFCR